MSERWPPIFSETPTEESTLYAVLIFKLSYRKAARPALGRPITCITAAMIHKPVVIITGASK
jgi:hypothetical protein